MAASLADVLFDHVRDGLCLVAPDGTILRGGRDARPRSRRAHRPGAAPSPAQPEDVQRVVEAGFDAHLAKPPDLADVEKLIG